VDQTAPGTTLSPPNMWANLFGYYRCNQRDLDHPCSILQKSLGIVNYPSFSVGRAREVSIPNSTRAYYQTSRRKFPENGKNKFNPKLIIINNVDQAVPVTSYFSPEFAGFCPFIDSQAARGHHPLDCNIFSAENRKYSII